MSKNNGYEEFSKRTKEDKKRMTGRMCPISPNIPTRMTREGFVRACKTMRSGAYKRVGKSTSYKQESDYYLCPECRLAKLVDSGKPFPPPPCMVFVHLDEFDKDHEPTELERMQREVQVRRSMGKYPVMTREIVEWVRDWHRREPGVTITDKAAAFGISRRQMGRILSGQRWR